MANEEHLSILRQGVEVWNKWREQNPNIQADLSRADLSGADLGGADLYRTKMYQARMNKVNLRQANLAVVGLYEAYLSGSDLSGANLTLADLYRTDLCEAILVGANLSGADLRMAQLKGADLSKTNLRGANLVETNLENAKLIDCQAYGISVWNANLSGATQRNIVITDHGESAITVDNLQIAQFIYLLLNNENVRNIIDTLTTKVVLILGRFTPERKAVLDAIRQELRKHNYTPILFDFDKPSSRNFTETVITLASLARFVIADLSDPNSLPHELASFVEKLPSVPVQAIFCPVPEHKHEKPYSMFEDHFGRLSHVLPIYWYESQEQLLSVLSEKVIEPAEAKVEAMKPKKFS